MLEELWRVKLGYFDFFPLLFLKLLNKKRHWINCWKPLIWSRLDYDSDIGHWTKNSSGAHCPPVKKQLTVGRTDSWPVNSWLNLLTSENKLRAWSQRGFQQLRKLKTLKSHWNSKHKKCLLSCYSRKVSWTLSVLYVLILNKKLSLVRLQWGLQGSYSTYWLFLNLEI